MPTQRLALPTTLATRDASMARDGLLTNCYHEKDPSGEAISKRPGYSVGPNLGIGCGQGLITYNGQAYAIRADTFYTLGGAVSVVTGTTWTTSAGPAKPVNNESGSTARAGSLVSMGGVLYSVGGRSQLDTASSVYKSVDNGANWSLLTANIGWGTSNALYPQTATALNGTLFVVHTDKTVWKSTDGTAWTKTSNDLTGGAANSLSLSPVAMLTHGSQLYVFCGSAAPGLVVTVWSSADGITWTNKNVGITGLGPRNGFVVTSFLGSLYLIGGFNDSGVVKNDVWRSADGGTTWSQIQATAAFAVRAFPMIWVLGAQMIIAGGSNVTALASGNVRSDVWTSLDGILWTQATTAAGWTARAAASYTVHNGTPYLGAGTGAGGLIVAGAQVMFYAAAAIPAATSVAITPAPVQSCLPFQFAVLPAQGANPPLLVMKNILSMYVFNGTTVLQITDPDYPVLTVPGVAYLDGAFYVMDAKGIIYGSDFNDPTSWNALNFIAAQAEADNGVVIARQLNYVMAFKQWSTEVFYDAANPTGSALGRVQNALFEVGCAAAGSIAYSDNTIFFMASSRQKGRSVMRLEGYSPQTVSTGFIDRILDADSLATVYAFVVKSRGHMLYVLTLKTSGLTLVYDAKTGDWHRWTSLAAQPAQSVTSLTIEADGLTATAQTVTAHNFGDGDPTNMLGAAVSAANGQFNIKVVSSLQFSYPLASAQTPGAVAGTITAQGYSSQYFPGVFYTYTANADLLLDEQTGSVYVFDPTLSRDNGAPIDVRVRTMIEDFGTSKQKSFGSLRIVGDRIATTLLARHTEDDYQTWSNYRPIDLGRNDPKINRMGKGRRRAHEFRHTDNTPLRLIAAELEVEMGSA